MEAMLGTLSIEERKDRANTFRISIAAAAFLAFAGAVFTIYAIIAMARSYQAGFAAVAGSLVLAFMGLMLLVSAVWLGVRAFNRRGA
jgi:hypothetical protein